MEHKKFKFTGRLIPLILSGKKTVTWKLWDDKDLRAGDIVDFLEFETLNHFATAEITSVKEKLFADLNQEDEEGHEEKASLEEMRRVMAEYHKKPVGPETPVKIVRFKLI